MTRNRIIIVVVLVVVVLLGGGYAYQRFFSRDARIRKLREDRDAAIARGDTASAERLNAQLRGEQELETAGGPAANLAITSLNLAERHYANSQSKFREYKNVDYSDWVKRNNTRNDLNRIGEAMVGTYGQALRQASTRDDVQAILESLALPLAASEERVHCYGDRAGGCDRQYDWTEADGMQKVREEWARVNEPLKALIVAAEDKLRTLEGATST